MNDHLIDLEDRALAVKNQGDFEQAAALFEQLLREEPSWEHGYGFFSLAECYEELGRYGDARSAYDKALQSSPDDPIILGGFASFLYLYGNPQEAFQAHLRLL